MIQFLKKWGKYIISGIGAIGSLIGLAVLASFRNGKEDEKIEQFVKEQTDKHDEIKQKEKKINENVNDSVNRVNDLNSKWSRP